MSNNDTPGVIAPPPLIALASVLAGWGLGAVMPLATPASLAWPGWALLAAGLGLALWAERRFAAVDTPAPPWKPARALALDGPSRFTRNPMYLGILLAQAGLGLGLGQGWIVGLTAATFAVLHHFVVLREERYLCQKFGAEYEGLLARTRRWL
jgi:protein-S-isoprenylcysteine O-methyltransferase Ste14